MKFTGLTYRPPFEADSLLLQVTAGCSHNRCAFCTMYKGVPFEKESMEQIETNLKEASAYADRVKRVFLENGDPFCLDYESLKKISELIHKYLPNVSVIAMYASIGNIKSKTDAELKTLRSYGINELNIGVESGMDDALKLMNKGYTAAEAAAQLKRLKNAGMDWGANVIFGCAGSGRGRQNALLTAQLLNMTEPYLIFTGTVHADPGCPLYDDMASGAFRESTVREYIDEEKTLLKHLEVENCLYFGLHPSNIVRMQGYLPRDRDALIEHLADSEKRLGPYLDKRPERGGEGAVYL